MWQDAEDLKAFISERLGDRPNTPEVYAEIFTIEEIEAMNNFIIALEMKQLSEKITE